ncbi:hypothetical protein [Agrobacterium pusense]|uniref:hypothetical protein n=1 Tax=Agrobacterium pusense TaxID=648995 RepID=UPI00130045E6|nr:hypothetical protein [Agrobacterium pusense]
MTNSNLSHHAAQRAQQRGFSNGLIQFVLDHHDVDFYAGGGCRVLRVSRQHAEQASIATLSRQLVERLVHVAIVWSDNTAQVVTILHMKSGRQGHRYRRQYRN